MSQREDMDNSDDFTFESKTQSKLQDKFSTPSLGKDSQFTANDQEFPSPLEKGTSPLRLNIIQKRQSQQLQRQSQRLSMLRQSLHSNEDEYDDNDYYSKNDENVDINGDTTSKKDADYESSKTPEVEKTDFNYLSEKLNNMPGSWYLKNGPFKEDQPADSEKSNIESNTNSQYGNNNGDENNEDLDYTVSSSDSSNSISNNNNPTANQQMNGELLANRNENDRATPPIVSPQKRSINIQTESGDADLAKSVDPSEKMKKRLSRNINYKRNSLISVPPPEIPTASSSNKSSTQNSSSSSLSVKDTAEIEPEPEQQQQQSQPTQEHQTTMSKINGLGKSFSQILHFSKKKKIPEDANETSRLSNNSNAGTVPVGDVSIDGSLTETVHTNEIDQNNSLKNTDYYSGDESSVSESNFINIDDHRNMMQDEDEPEHEIMSSPYNDHHKFSNNTNNDNNNNNDADKEFVGSAETFDDDKTPNLQSVAKFGEDLDATPKVDKLSSNSEELKRFTNPLLFGNSRPTTRTKSSMPTENIINLRESNIKEEDNDDMVIDHLPSKEKGFASFNHRASLIQEMKTLQSTSPSRHGENNTPKTSPTKNRDIVDEDENKNDTNMAGSTSLDFNDYKSHSNINNKPIIVASNESTSTFNSDDETSNTNSHNNKDNYNLNGKPGKKGPLIINVPDNESLIFGNQSEDHLSYKSPRTVDVHGQIDESVKEEEDQENEASADNTGKNRTLLEEDETRIDDNQHSFTNSEFQKPFRLTNKVLTLNSDKNDNHQSVSSSIYSSRVEGNNNVSEIDETIDPAYNNNENLNELSNPTTENKKPRISIKPSLHQSYASSRYSERNNSSRSLILDQAASNLSKSANLAASKSDSQYQDIYDDVNEYEDEDDEYEDGDDDEEEDDESALFVTAIYQFDANSLESESDTSICLSFNKNDIAFTYALDESGWGEVTMLNTLKRGWVPMNYFRATLINIQDLPTDGDEIANIIAKGKKAKLAASKKPLTPLFRVSGKFLLNPQSKPIYKNSALKGYTFDIELINGISEGVKSLLNETNCLSRTTDIIRQKPVIRKIRKKLLRDWYDLIVKAREYNHTFNPTKIEVLQLMTYQVLRKAVAFLEIWGLESEELISNRELVNPNDSTKESISTYNESESSFQFNLLYLPESPNATNRINELHGLLISYLGLVIGRLDLVERNVKGCQVFETIFRHILLLIHEWQFISKITSNLVPFDMDNEEVTDGIPSLSAQVKTLEKDLFNLEQYANNMMKDVNLIVDAANRRNIHNTIGHGHNKNKELKKPNKEISAFFYSSEGGSLITTASKMVGSISSSFRILISLLRVTKDYKLPETREYPDFLKLYITPEQFIKKCTTGLIHDKDVNRQIKNYQRQKSPSSNNIKNMKTPKMTQSGDASNSSPTSIFNNRTSKRFSMFRVGNATDMEFTNDGLDLLAGIMPNTTSPFINKNDGAFQGLLDDEDNEHLANNDQRYEFDPETEIIRDPNANLLGASFKALVSILTDENQPPDYFFISTFFLTFRIFSNASIFLEELVSRFDVNNKPTEIDTQTYSPFEYKLRSRRKLICKTFQLWLESYWQPKSDYILLAPLMNFFNEGVKEFLPVAGVKLIEIASRLVGSPPTESENDKLNYYSTIDNDHQLIPRKISTKLQKKHITRHLSNMSLSNMVDELDTFNSFMDDIDTYELEDVNPADKKGIMSRSSLNLGITLDVKNTGSISLVLPDQIENIKKLIISYRNMLGNHWIDQPQINVYTPLSTEILLNSWWNTSQESWKIMNHELALLNFNGLEIAKQLTLIENKMFCSIKAEELLNQNFTTKKLHLNLSPNIQRSVLFTNLLSDYVIESILQPGLSLKQRTHILKCWLKISISCLYLRNFNSLASIMTSLQSFLISRVHKIWSLLSTKYKDLFQYLTSIIHPEKNYHIYRKKIREFLNSSLEDNLDIPIVPYLSLFLQDLTFVVDGNPNYRVNKNSFLDQKLINFDKYLKITKIISDLQTLQVAYTDVGELGSTYNSKTDAIVRSQTIKTLKSYNQEFSTETNTDTFVDMFDIAGVPSFQELILLEIWKVKQINMKEDDRAWKLSCEVQPREE
ncbi:hypothetical protein B5S29_g2952 [[Candida] boidinii]|nr:hypothetical protein B5S29_g2952 [[Candida] boidinii]